MAHAYQSAEDGQLVISDQPRADLEALARWQEIDVDEAKGILDARNAEPVTAENDEGFRALIDYLTEHDLTPADLLATLTASENPPPAAVADPAGPPAAEAQTPSAAEAPAGNASTEKWADYARSLGVAVDADADRAAIKAAIDAHKAAQ